VVAEIGRQFKREFGYDLAPFDSSHPDMEGRPVRVAKVQGDVARRGGRRRSTSAGSTIR
jgi:hypothetical protein